MRERRTMIVAACVAVGWAALGLARETKVESGWPQVPVRVDGTGEQWGGHLVPLPYLPVLLGVQNDGKFLYLCVKTSDRRLKAQIRYMGLTVWVNGAGKDKRGYGVRFPVGTGFPRRPREEDGPRPTPTEGPAPDVLPDTSRVELIGPTDDDRLRVDRTDAAPVEAAFGDEEGVWVIEFRFPLAPTDAHPLAVGAAPGATVAVGLEIEPPKVERFARRESDEGEDGGEGDEGAPGGSWGGPGGGMGGHGGRFGGSGRGMGGRAYVRPIKAWTLVTLATPPPLQPAAK